VGLGEADFSGISPVTAALPLVTTISEVAIIRHVNGVRHLSGNGIELFHMLSYHRLGSH